MNDTNISFEFETDLDDVLKELKTMLIEKNQGYGDSAVSPVRIFSKSDNIERIKVRIDDKLSRIMRGSNSIKEDIFFDLIGYFVLLRIAEKRIVVAPTVMNEHNHVHVELEKEPDRTVLTPAPDAYKLAVKYPAKNDILIEKFEYDKNHKQFFENVFIYEQPNGKVAIQYADSTYYTTQDRVRTLPYPFPFKFFDNKTDGWNSTVEQAIKKYRKYLAQQDEKNDPDRPFKKMLNTNTRPDRNEQKVEGELE